MAEEIGLFPLGIVLLPTERVPLHIFEERYKELIGECLAGGTEFGLVFASGEEFADVGTRARVADVLTQFPDGRLNILVEGGRRFTLERLTDGRSFQTGVVTTLADTEDQADADAVGRALELFARLREITGSEVEVPSAGSPQLSYRLAGLVELPVEDKLALLRDHSERSRMERVCKLFDVAVAAAERIRVAVERASTNGRVELE